MRLFFVILCAVLVFTASCVWGKSDTPKLNLAPNHSFEADLSKIKSNLCVYGGWFPVGIVPDSGKGKIEIVEDVARSGKKSLKIIPNPGAQVTGTQYFSRHNGGAEVRKAVTGNGIRGACTLGMRLDQDILSCEATAWVKKNDQQKVSLKAIWHTRQERDPYFKLAEEAVTEPAENRDGWYRYSLTAYRVHSAHRVEFAFDTEGNEPLYVDDVEIYFNRFPHAKILVDQLGYETNAQEKGIVLQSSIPLSSSLPPFSVISLNDFTTVLTGNWVDQGYFRDWDWYYWNADISALKTPGRYVIESKVGDKLLYSQPFEIQDDLLLNHTGKLGYLFFYSQRCGMAVPGFHAACHLDDAKMPDGSYKDLSGGWHDAGDYNKYNGYTPESMYALISAYDRRKEFYDQFDDDKNGKVDILDEALWGAQYLKKCIDPKTLEMTGTISSGYRYWGKPEAETDNLPNTGDERPLRDLNGDPSFCISGFALLGKHLSDKSYVDLAERLYRKHGGNMDKLLALYSATQDEEYHKLAVKRAEQLLSEAKTKGAAAFMELAEFAAAFPKDQRVSAIRSLAAQRLQEMKKICANIFGITRRVEPDGSMVFFRHYLDVNDWYVGESRELLDMAYEGILLDKLGFPKGRELAENQVHWILGRNPYAVSMMEGVGSVFVPYYHHRYNAIPGNPRGAVPGAIVNGITRAWPDYDRPWLDLHPQPNPDYQPNEPWLPHNNRWLFLLSIW